MAESLQQMGICSILVLKLIFPTVTEAQVRAIIAFASITDPRMKINPLLPYTIRTPA